MTKYLWLSFFVVGCVGEQHPGAPAHRNDG
jgi:hypothetical protein